MTKIFSRFSVREYLLTFALVAVGVVSFLSVSAQDAPVTETVVQESDGGMELQGFRGTGVVNPGCFDNYQTWHKSYSYKSNANWNLTIFNTELRRNWGTFKTKGNFLDLNGDGLVDYFYKSRKSNSSN